MSKPVKYAAINRYARKVAFRSYAAECDDYPLGFDPVLTDRLVGTIADGVREAVRLRFPGGRIKTFSDQLVRTWLERQGEYTPFVDEVAVRRMVDFDWSVFPSLSGDERKAVGARMARMDDPYGEVVRDLFGSTVAEVRPARRERWLAGTELQRVAVTQWRDSAWRAIRRQQVAA